MPRSVSFSRLIATTAAGFSLAVVAWSARVPAVGTRHFVFDSAKDFEGDLRGVAVDSLGRLEPGLALVPNAVSEAPALWGALEHNGGLLLATGSEGKLLEFKGGKTRVVADSDALALTSIVKAFGRVFVGSLPGGRIFELKGDKLEPFVTLKDGDHVFALAADEKEKALYAATGPEGKLFRITAEGNAQVYFDSDQAHLVSVAVGGGAVYAGSSGEARLYKVSGPGRATVLRDFETTEVRAIAVAPSGDVYAAANELKGAGRSDSVSGNKAPGPQSQSAAKGRGVLYRFSPNGEPEELYAEKDDHIVTLVLDDKQQPVIGTGGEGRVIRVEADHHSVILADLEQRQAAHVALAGQQGWVIGSDPIVVHKVDGLGGKDAAFTSKVLDAGLRGRFGRITWDAQGRVEVATRTGNTKEPDASWSEFAGATDPFEAKSPAGRYLQVRVRLLEPQASLGRLEVPFVTDNLRAVVTEVKADGSGTNKGSSSGLSKSGGPLGEKASATIKVSWKIDNPDEDELRYRVEYRPVASTTWFDALTPGQVLTDEKWSWETENLPEGKYRLRVTASDELSNPPGRVTRHSLESFDILVDNTAPVLSGLTVQGRKLSGKVRDGAGTIRRIELRVAGTEEWLPLDPSDGIFDEQDEDFSVDLSSAIPAGPQLVTVRAFDSASNFEVAHVRLAK
ncbi:MAG TPA: hypothetical protein VLC09_19595 [Polyangiaceae bacterium]|nr:hypothetical protein [Polyangiaceae bacterium]